ncbi:MAG: AraC family transcriptional regulator [Victivallales bacterium]|jgi:AraC-like DNA-binding protein
MLNILIAHLGVYKEPEKFIQTVRCPWISFYVSGLKYSRDYLPDGRLIRDAGPGEKPCFSVKSPGMKVDFEFLEGRENWVIMLKDVSIRSSSDGKTAEIFTGAEWVQIPYYVEIPEERVEGWQMEMRRIKESCLNPTPLNSFRVQLGVMNILRFMIDRNSDTLGFTPEEKLKRLIDEDFAFSKSINEMSRSCSLSSDHLRVLFQKRFQISPLAYRNQKRSAYMMELIANSSLSVKEISSRTGFRHASHFCMECRKHFGMTPLEGIRKFRNCRIQPNAISS